MLPRQNISSRQPCERIHFKVTAILHSAHGYFQKWCTDLWMSCARYVDTHRSGDAFMYPHSKYLAQPILTDVILQQEDTPGRVQLPPHSAVTSPKPAPASLLDACSIHAAHFPGKSRVHLCGCELLEAFNKSPLKCSSQVGRGGHDTYPYPSPHYDGHSAQPVGLVPTHPPSHPLLSLPSPVGSLRGLKWLATQLPYISMSTTSICWKKKSRS